MRSPESPELKLAAIEGHHLVKIRDTELMHFCSVILPSIDCVFAFLCDPCPGQIRCLTYSVQRQAVACFQVTAVVVECDAKFDNGLFLLSQWIADESHFDHGISIIFHRGRRTLAEILQFERADQVPPRVIFFGRQVLLVVILAVPLRYKSIRANGEFIELSLLVQNANEFAGLVINAEADRAFQRRRDEAEAEAS